MRKCLLSCHPRSVLYKCLLCETVYCQRCAFPVVAPSGWDNRDNECPSCRTRGKQYELQEAERIEKWKRNQAEEIERYNEQQEVKPNEQEDKFIYDKPLEKIVLASIRNMDLTKLESAMKRRKFGTSEMREILLKAIHVYEDREGVELRCGDAWITIYCNTFPQIFEDNWYPSNPIDYQDRLLDVLWENFGHAINPSSLMESALSHNLVYLLTTDYGHRFFEFFQNKGGAICLHRLDGGVHFDIELIKTIKGKIDGCTGFPSDFIKYMVGRNLDGRSWIIEPGVLEELFATGADVNAPIGDYYYDAWLEKRIDTISTKIHDKSLFELGISEIRKAPLLTIAIIDDDLEAVNYLIDCGADVNQVCQFEITFRQIEEFAPLDVARALRRSGLIDILKNSGAKRLRNRIADFGYHDDIYQLDVLEELIASGADLNTPIGNYYLEETRDVDTASIMLHDNALVELHITGVKNAPLLTLAIIEDNSDAVRYLIDSGANINQVCEFSIGHKPWHEFTPLDVAKSLNRATAIDILKNAGAKINQTLLKRLFQKAR